jgi:hypothetical protein
VSFGLRFYDPNLQNWVNRDPIAEHGGLSLHEFAGNNPISLLDILGLRPCYKWMLVTFYTGPKPSDGRNPWNQKDLTDMDAATGLAGYTYNPAKKCADKTGPKRGINDYT